jgi:uncharacterized protein (DUF1330 family)
MSTKLKSAIVLLVGAGLGAAVVEGLHAQATGPAYVVVAIRKVNDADGFKTLLPKAAPAVEAAGGKFVVRTDKITSLDGPAPARFVLLQFDSVEKAQAFHNSAAQKEIDEIRLKTTDSLSFIVEGMPK